MRSVLTNYTKNTATIILDVCKLSVEIPKYFTMKMIMYLRMKFNSTIV